MWNIIHAADYFLISENENVSYIKGPYGGYHSSNFKTFSTTETYFSIRSTIFDAVSICPSKLVDRIETHALIIDYLKKLGRPHELFMHGTTQIPSKVCNQIFFNSLDSRLDDNFWRSSKVYRSNIPNFHPKRGESWRQLETLQGLFRNLVDFPRIVSNSLKFFKTHSSTPSDLIETLQGS